MVELVEISMRLLAHTSEIMINSWQMARSNGVGGSNQNILEKELADVFLFSC